MRSIDRCAIPAELKRVMCEGIVRLDLFKMYRLSFVLLTVFYITILFLSLLYFASATLSCLRKITPSPI